MGAVGQLKSQLFATPLEGQLQITARRRKFATSGATSIPATGTATATATIVIDIADVLQEPDAYQFDFVLATFLAASPGITVNSLSLLILSQQNVVFPIANPTITLTAVPIGKPASAAAGVNPILWTSRDLNFGITQVLAALSAVQQPLNIQLQGQFANSTAGAINVTMNLFCFYRLVRGLQEG